MRARIRGLLRRVQKLAQPRVTIEVRRVDRDITGQHEGDSGPWAVARSTTLPSGVTVKWMVQAAA